MFVANSYCFLLASRCLEASQHMLRSGIADVEVSEMLGVCCRLMCCTASQQLRPALVPNCAVVETGGQKGSQLFGFRIRYVLIFFTSFKTSNPCQLVPVDAPARQENVTKVDEQSKICLLGLVCMQYYFAHMLLYEVGSGSLRS